MMMTFINQPTFKKLIKQLNHKRRHQVRVQVPVEELELQQVQRRQVQVQQKRRVWRRLLTT